MSKHYLGSFKHTFKAKSKLLNEVDAAMHCSAINKQTVSNKLCQNFINTNVCLEDICKC